MDPFEDSGNRDGKLYGLTALVNRQFPGLLAAMMPTASEARKQNRELGLSPSEGKTHQDTGVVKLPDELKFCVEVFGRKLAKAIYYKEVAAPFPNEGSLLMNWFTNADLIQQGKYVSFEVLKQIAGDIPEIERNGKYLNDQFELKTSFSADKGVFVVQTRFGRSFGMVLWGAVQPGLLEGAIERLRKHHGGDGPFAVLQSQASS